MRKLGKPAKKKKKTGFIVAVVLAILMLASSIGYSFLRNDNDTSDDSRVFYGSFEFVETNEIWNVLVGGREFYFRNLPSEVENISVNGSYILEKYENQPLYIVNNNPASHEILSNLGQFVLRYQEACLSAEECDGNFPIKNCDDNLIVFVESNETRVHKDGECVYISGDFLKGSDTFLYRLFGII